MKKVLIYFAMAVVLALGSTSCSDFLEIEPVGAVNETNLTDQEGINYLLTGIFSVKYSGGYDELLFWGKLDKLYVW